MSRKKPPIPNANSMTLEELLHGRKPPRFWESLNNTLTVARAIKIKHNISELPTIPELIEMGYSSFYYAISNYHESMEAFRTLLGENSKRKRKIKTNSESGKYKTKEGLLKGLYELWDLFPEVDKTLPTAKWLKEHNYASLSKSIETHHDGFIKVRRDLNLKVGKKQKLFYKNELSDWDRLVEEITQMQNQFPEVAGTLPTQEWLKDNGYISLSRAIFLYHGGFREVKNKLGYKNTTKKSGYWKNKNNFDYELKKVIDELGHFPSHSELNALKKSTISTHFSKHYANKNEARVAFGFEPVEPKIDRYKEWGVVKKELENIIKKEGKLVGGITLKKKGFGILVDAILSYHGGMNSVRKKLNQELEENPYQTLEGVKKELMNIWMKFPEKKGTLPPDNWLRKQGYSKLGHSIYRLHEGFSKVRQQLGLKSKGGVHKHKKGHLDNWKNLLKEIQQIYEDYPDVEGTLPTGKWLLNNGYGNVYTAILNHHGGINCARKKIGQKALKKEKGFWKNMDNVLDKIKEVHEETGEPYENIIKTYWLNENNLGSMYAAIKKHHGGLSAIRNIFNVETEIKPPGFWKIWDNYKSEFLKAIEQYEEVPSGSQMIRDGHNSLIASSKYHGGINEVKRKLGLLEEDTSSEDLESLLNQYVGGDK